MRSGDLRPGRGQKDVPTKPWVCKSTHCEGRSTCSRSLAGVLALPESCAGGGGRREAGG